MNKNLVPVKVNEVVPMKCQIRKISSQLVCYLKWFGTKTVTVNRCDTKLCLNCTEVVFNRYLVFELESRHCFPIEAENGFKSFVSLLTEIIH